MQDRYNIQNILSIWLNPRDAIWFFLKNKTKSTHLKIILISTSLYCLQFIALLAIFNLLPFSAKSTSWLLLQGIFWLFLLIVAIYVTLSNIISLVIQFLARSLGGTGNLLETKFVVYWSSLCLMPTTFLYLVFSWNSTVGINTREQGLETPLFLDLLQIFTAMGILTFITYWMIVLSKMLSEIHKLSIWRAAIAALGGAVSALAVVILFYMF